MHKPGRSRFGLAGTLGFFVAGLVIGLGLVSDLGAQFIAGLIIVAGLCFGLFLLARVAENTRTRVTAGEASYRARRSRMPAWISATTCHFTLAPRRPPWGRTLTAPASMSRPPMASGSRRREEAGD